MMNTSLLGHLTFRLSNEPENLATEALLYILQRSPAAEACMRRILSSCGLIANAPLKYASQQLVAESARPDLTGTQDGVLRLIIESKFWAGLTQAQPVEYLKALAEQGGVLLFISPKIRVDILWPELLRRASGVTPNGNAVPGPDKSDTLRFQNVGKAILAIIAWSDLLTTLQSAVNLAGEGQAAEDICQLLGLCERMDGETILPLSSEELTSPIGRRIIQFGTLATTLTEKLVQEKKANVKGLKAIGSNGWYGKYFRLGGYTAFLHYSSWKWSYWGDSPLWIWLKGPKWKPTPAVNKALQAAKISFRASEKDGCVVPIYLMIGVEQDRVIETAMEQLRHIHAALNTDAPTTTQAEDLTDEPPSDALLAPVPPEEDSAVPLEPPHSAR